ncbi:NAD(P)/FAD-dependent oxidoreductase [Kocuria sp. M1R5S2]|uniref:NAD(P)/FAD-dependent oxidoreductase n=1 Tax=Kocuria rhizosphaerae TaxID=3376285 RepID=UPI0037B96355
MLTSQKFSDTPSRVLVVGGGYVGLYVALKLQKKVAARGGIVTLVDPRPYMTYQPLLPEVASGSVEARHVVVPHRRHLPRTEVVTGTVTAIDHDRRTATVEASEGTSFELPYRDVVVAAGAVTRTFPVPGLAEHGIGLKTVEEALTLRNGVLERIEHASLLPPGSPERARALTVVGVGGGFAGIEAIAELEDMARHAVAANPRLDRAELRFVLVEAMGRVMPEVTEQQAGWVVEHLRSRGVEVLLNTSLASAVDGVVELVAMPDRTPVQSFPADTLLWTAGVQAAPAARHFGFPLDPRGRITADATLRILDAEDRPVEGAWTAGDVAAVPDLTGGGVGGYCVPNAQHAVRQAKHLAANLYSARFGTGRLEEYEHHHLGVVAGLGKHRGVGRVLGLELKGAPAWLAHRGYHGAAVPTWERKLRVLADWSLGAALGRDTTGTSDVAAPYRAFRSAAAPVPPPAETVAGGH